MRYTLPMRVEKTDEYRAWIDGLKDQAGRARILMRVDRLVHGNPGVHRNLSEGVSELKIDVGPGYRVYYSQRGSRLLLLIAGGEKSAQAQDIAQTLVKEGAPVFMEDGTEAQDETTAFAALQERKIIALIAYLQKLGAYEPVEAKPVPPVINPLEPKIPDTFRKYTRDEPAPKTATAGEIVREALGMRCLLYTSPSPRDRTRSRMPSSA